MEFAKIGVCPFPDNAVFTTYDQFDGFLALQNWTSCSRGVEVSMNEIHQLTSFICQHGPRAATGWTLYDWLTSDAKVRYPNLPSPVASRTFLFQSQINLVELLHGTGPGL